MIIRYEVSDKAWSGITEVIEEIIHKHRITNILEVGAGANPLFPAELMTNHGVKYTLLDISSEELAKAPPVYQTIEADIGAKSLKIEERFDFIFSRMLAEHIKDGRAFHQNVANLLVPGGIAFHFFPTLYAPPFVVNRLLPENAARALLNLIQAGREQAGNKGKFPAYYSWCRGPTRAQISRFRSVGLEVIEYIGFFGHSGYYKKLPLAEKLHRSMSNWLAAHPISGLTSFSYVILKKDRREEEHSAVLVSP